MQILTLPMKLNNTCKDVNTRFMYDVARKAIPAYWVCEVIYPYADDTHYQTALFKAGIELNLI